MIRAHRANKQVLGSMPVRGWSGVAPTIVAAIALIDPFAFFQPTFRVQPSERATLSRGNAFARTVKAPPGNVTIVAAVAVQIDGARLEKWMRDIAALKKSAIVKQIGRFSPTPSIDDVRSLTLDQVDIEEIRSCRPTSCGVKLSPGEIERIQSTAGAEDSDEVVQDAFREVIVARVADYLRSGRSAPPTPAFLETNWPEVSREIREFPQRELPEAESFLYWSKDAYAGKPIISITHVTIVHGQRPGEPDVLVAGRQLFATHYTDGAWSFTSLVRDDRKTYLVYLNQSEIDLLNTWYGGLVRRVVERRLREEAVDVLNGLRRRLESGDPPVHASE